MKLEIAGPTSRMIGRVERGLRLDSDIDILRYVVERKDS